MCASARHAFISNKKQIRRRANGPYSFGLMRRRRSADPLDSSSAETAPFCLDLACILLRTTPNFSPLV